MTDRISVDDPRHAAALRVLVAMHEYFNLDRFGGAVRWLEDTSGRVVIFTRGEYRDRILAAVHENITPTQQFEYKEIELDGYRFAEADADADE